MIASKQQDASAGVWTFKAVAVKRAEGAAAAVSGGNMMQVSSSDHRANLTAADCRGWLSTDADKWPPSRLSPIFPTLADEAQNNLSRSKPDDCGGKVEACSIRRRQQYMPRSSATVLGRDHRNGPVAEQDAKGDAFDQWLRFDSVVALAERQN